MDNSRRAERSLAYVARSHTPVRPTFQIARPGIATQSVPEVVHLTVPQSTLTATVGSSLQSKGKAVMSSHTALPVSKSAKSATTHVSHVRCQSTRRHHVPALQYKTATPQIARPASVVQYSLQPAQEATYYQDQSSSTEQVPYVEATQQQGNFQEEFSTTRAFRIRRFGKANSKRVRTDFRQKIIYSMALCIFVFGMGVVAQGLLTNQQAGQQVKVLSAQSNETQTNTNVVPSEEKPKGDYLNSYVVSSALPRLLRIPSIGVKARVLQVGVDSDNQMGTPRNIYDSAWYTASAKPGEPGAVVIDGHYSGPTSHGVFSKLSQLKLGEVIEVERGDGIVFRYQVMKNETKQIDQVDMSRLLVSSDTSKPGLNLITCGGAYDAKTNTFPARTVVNALQL